MKTFVKAFLATLVLVTCAAAQEPKQALDKQAPTGDSKMHTVTGSKPNTVVLEPKALPPLNPSLGDIARQARAARAAAQKAEVVVETDTVKADALEANTAETDTAETDTAQQK
jgi:hypothetical protein